MSCRYGRHVAALGGLIVGVCLVAGTVAAQGVGQAVQAKGEGQSGADPQGNRYAGIALSCAPSGNGQAYTCHRERPAEPLGFADHLGRVAFRGARDPIAILTLLLFVIGGLQVEISRRTARRQLRAYMGVNDFTFFDGATLDPPQPENFNRPGVILQIRNTGQTPAYDVFHNTRIEVRPVHEEGLLVTPGKIEMSKSYTPREGNLIKTVELGRQLAPQELDGIRNRTHGIYVMGRIDYRDTFRKARYATYRLRYNGAYPPPTQGQLVIFCDNGNDAD